MKAICKREIHALMRGLRGWGYVAVVLLGAAVSVLVNNALGKDPQFETNLRYIALAMIPAAAILTADSFQAERHSNAERLLYALPVRNGGIVAGKLLALIVPVLVASVGLCLFPAFLSLFGSVSMRPAAAAIIGLGALGVFYVAAGLFISACAPNRWVAALITLAALLFFWFLPTFTQRLPQIGIVPFPVAVACALGVLLIVWLLSGSGLLATVLAAAVEIPLLYSCFQGGGSSLFNACVEGLKSIDPTGELTRLQNGLLDGSVWGICLLAAVLFAFLTALHIANRRQGRRALS